MLMHNYYDFKPNFADLLQKRHRIHEINYSKVILRASCAASGRFVGDDDECIGIAQREKREGLPDPVDFVDQAAARGSAKV